MTTSTDTISETYLAPTPVAPTVPVLEPRTLPPVEIIDHRPSLWSALHDAWRNRHLVPALAVSVLGKYRRKYRLGFFWPVFNALLSIFGLSFIFGGGVFGVKAPNGMPYFLFVTVGMMGWRIFIKTMTIATRSFLRVRFLTRKMHIPLVVVPIAGSAQVVFELSVYASVYVGGVLYYWIRTGHLYLKLEPKLLAISFLGLGLCALFAWSIAMWTAPLTAWARDVRMVVKHTMPFWMFMTPVVYPIDKLHGTTRLLAEINPLTSAIEMAKVGFLGSGHVRFYAGIWSIAAISTSFLAGVWFISRYGQTLAAAGARFRDDGSGDDDDGDDMM